MPKPKKLPHSEEAEAALHIHSGGGVTGAHLLPEEYLEWEQPPVRYIGATAYPRQPVARLSDAGKLALKAAHKRKVDETKA